MSRLGGPAVVVFFAVYDEKVRLHISEAECLNCSDPDDSIALINPWNNLVEGPTLWGVESAPGQLSVHYSFDFPFDALLARHERNADEDHD